MKDGKVEGEREGVVNKSKRETDEGRRGIRSQKENGGMKPKSGERETVSERKRVRERNRYMQR